MIWIVVGVLATLVLVWLTGVLAANDFSLPLGKVHAENILVIFPHPDDEVLSCGGFMGKYSDCVTWAVLTKGERGTEGGKLDPSLKNTRTVEARQVAKLLGVTLIHKDLGDGQLKEKKHKLEKTVREIVSQVKPDLVITFDHSGLYGHEDHIAVSEALTKITEKRDMRLWYVSFPSRVLRMVQLPEEMAKDADFKNSRVSPTHKIFVGWHLLAKIRSLYAYKSQLFAFRKSYPKPLPLWFYVSLTVFEYFYEVE